MNKYPSKLLNVFNNVFKMQWSKGRDENVVRRAKFVVQFFGEDALINNINEQSIDNLINELDRRGLSAATKNRYLSALSTMVTFCLRRYDTYKLERKPYIKWFKEPKHELRFLTNLEERTMINLLTSWGWHDELDFFVMLIDTGMRLSELYSLKVKNCFEDVVTLYNTKNNDSRGIPLTKRVKQIINRHKEGKHSESRLFSQFARWHPDTCFRKVRKAMNLEHDKRFTIHCFRRTTACRLLNNQVPTKYVQQWLGHSDERMVEKYAKILSINLKSVVSVLEQSTEELNTTHHDVA